MTNGISLAPAGFSPPSPFSPSAAKKSPAVPAALNETETALAAILASAPGTQGVLGLGASPESGGLFSLGASRGSAAFDLAQLLTGESSLDGSLAPEVQFAQVRQAMIGTVLDLKK